MRLSRRDAVVALAAAGVAAGGALSYLDTCAESWHDGAFTDLDARLRTHDLHNLWIAGSSTFVTGGAMNPTLTIAALALKLADHLDGAL